MKKNLIAFFVAISMSSCSPRFRVPEDIKEPKLQDVVSLLQTQYKLAMDSLYSGQNAIKDFKISEADVSLKVSGKTTGSGDITVLIFKPAVKYIRTTTSTVTYVLTTKPNPLGGGPANKVDNSLRDAIVATIKNFHDLNLTSGFDQLTKDHVVLDIDFSVEVDKSGTITFKLWGIGADVSGESDKTVDHELKLTFTKGSLTN